VWATTFEDGAGVAVDVHGFTAMLPAQIITPGFAGDPTGHPR
jgi:hypothetical protein